MKKTLCILTALQFCLAVSACGSSSEQISETQAKPENKIITEEETASSYPEETPKETTKETTETATETETETFSQEPSDFPDAPPSDYFYDMEKVSDASCSYTVEMTEDSVILHLTAPSYDTLAFYLYKSGESAYQKCEIVEGESPHSPTVALPIKPSDMAELRILDSNKKNTYTAAMIERSDIIPEGKKGFIFEGFGFAPPVYVNVPDGIQDASFLYLEEEISYDMDSCKSQTAAVKLACDKTSEFTGEIYQMLASSVQDSVDMETMSWHLYSDDFVWRALPSDIEESMTDDGKVLVVRADIAGTGTYLIMAKPTKNPD